MITTPLPFAREIAVSSEFTGKTFTTVVLFDTKGGEVEIAMDVRLAEMLGRRLIESADTIRSMAAG